MDRNIVYPGSIPLDTDLLSINRNAMVGLGYLMQATLGTSTIVDGLVCKATVPASLTVNVGPGSITALGVLDATSYGSLPADEVSPLVQMGVNLGTTQFTLAAPTVAGQSANYLIQAAFAESDTDPVVLPYYNAANPAQPYSGPNNSGTAQNTQRIQRVQLQLKPGAPADSGSQQTPPVDPGWTGLHVIAVNFGQTQVLDSAITTLPTAPFVPFKLAQLAPGVSRIAVLNSSRTWQVPASVNLVRVRLWGAGGAGGPGGGGAGGGGAAGGYSEGYYSVIPGQTLSVVIGAGGANGAAGSSTGFGTVASASGGGAGGGGSSTAGGIASSAPGTGAGTGLLVAGTGGQNGLLFASGGYTGGMGGAAFGGGSAFGPAGGATTNLDGGTGCFPGGGGAGGIGTGAGGSGAPGLVVIEW